MDLKATYDRIAEDWFNDHRDDAWGLEGLDTFASFLPWGASVLDIGCGPGISSAHLVDKGLCVVGADFSAQMIEVAKREFPSIDFRIADITNVRTISESFDGVFAKAVLLHIPKEKVSSVISGLAKKLKDGGYLYLAVKEQRADSEEEQVVQGSDYGYEYERFFSFFTLPELEKHLVEARLEICYTNIAQTGHTNWIQIIAKKNFGAASRT